MQGALSFFVDSYVRIAEWRAVIERLAGFNVSIANAQECTARAPSIAVTAAPVRDVEIKDLEVALPSGQALVAADTTLAPHEDVLLTGPSGSGKSTLFRAMAGIWPFGKGTVTVPQSAKAMTLPQRPYLPIGTLEAAINYPSEPGTFDAARIRDLLVAVGLPAMTERVDERAHWSRTLSLGEQQRIGIARAILHAPDFLFLDEATASLDEPSEAEALQAHQGVAAEGDDHLDRASLNACGIPQARPHAGARWRALSNAGCGAQSCGKLV